MLDDYFRQYGLVAILGATAIAIPSGILLLSWLLSLFRVRPQVPNQVKSDIYECGMESIPTRWTQFNARYYTFALMFLIFDVETIFIYPWAIQFGVLSVKFGVFVLVEMFVFIAILVVAWLYAWRNHALEWK